MAGFFDVEGKNLKGKGFLRFCCHPDQNGINAPVSVFGNVYFSVLSLFRFARNVPNDENTPPAAKIQRKMIIC